MKLPVALFLAAATAAAAAVLTWKIVEHRHTSPLPANGTAAQAERQVRFYRCPMHPHITSDKPGKCTLCGMDLVPVYAGDATATADNKSESSVKLGNATSSVIGIETAAVRTAPLHRTLRVAGVISDDETRHRILSARVPGRIEKLHVNQVGLEVVRGQPLATIYSPDLLTAQRLYLENLRVGAGLVSASELASSREKLLALGLVEEDIRRLEESKKPDATLVLRTPFDGTIITRGKANEGQYVNVDDELFEIGDFSTLWFIFDAYERDLSVLALNQRVDVSLPSSPGEVIAAPIEFIDPNLNEATRTARVRVVLPNPARRILYRQTANGLVHIETPPTLLVPRSAVLHTREKPVAYVATGGGAYELRTLKLGKIGDLETEVLDGLKEGERVVTQAALLIDSQAQLEHLGSQNEKHHAASEGVAKAATATQPGAPSEHASHAHGDGLGHGHPAAAPSGIASAAATASPAAVATPVSLAPALLNAALDATTALSSDDLPGYQKHLSALKAAVHATSGPQHDTLAPLVEKLVAGTDLKSARDPFEGFSNALAGIVRAQPVAQRQAKIFQCRMSPVLGTALWLQKDSDETRNPFFGAAMYNCGAELK
ncbi:MAG: efflux RND transporter periplasmic adaptor subunit [Puniceicoccales bacterium]|jgi:Cu(I)/Ag(I) efflux system membrane fusion protein|nr:efflux RND transporter periplasmic adaptor subunit [Puniceicoccales bacterium]